ATVFMSASVRAIPVGDTPSEVGGAISNVGGVLGGLTSGLGGRGSADAARGAAGGLRKRRVRHLKGEDAVNGENTAGRFDTVGGVGGIVQDAIQNAGDTVSNALSGIRKRDVRDTAGKRKRSVVGEPDEEEADEEEPEEEEVDENEEETDEEEADELGDAAPAGRR
ncbi:hypothetical protein PS6_010732, partial [Mucor atramentarius]